jgi:hypothetical protein
MEALGFNRKEEVGFMCGSEECVEYGESEYEG